jgi:hypothetical protein
MPPGTPAAARSHLHCATAAYARERPLDGAISFMVNAFALRNRSNRVAPSPALRCSVWWCVPGASGTSLDCGALRWWLLTTFV